MIFYIFIFSLLQLLCIHKMTNAAVPPAERQALTDIFNTMNGGNWPANANWLNGDPCSSAWDGVTCIGGSVSSLNLDYNNVVGSLPSTFVGLKNLTSFSANSNAISGNITLIFSILPPALYSLNLGSNLIRGVIPTLPDSWTNLDLSLNSLTGAISALPSGMGSLTLNNNQLIGSIPVLPSALTALVLRNNVLTGGIPVIPLSIYYLDLSNNKLTGPIPNLNIKLNYLYLNNNRLNGPIPSFPSSLYAIDLSSNLLSGPIPTIPAATNSLYLSSNSLNGVLPPGLCSRSFSNSACYIDNNRFTSNCSVCHYSVPTTTSSVDTQALRDFYSSTNGGSWFSSQNWLVGDPCKNNWFGVTCDTSLSVLGLDLTKNNVTGPLPISIGNLTYLTKLSMSGNGISGSILSFLSNMASLTNLTLSNNRLSGVIPALPVNLIAIDLSGNQLTGSIPSLTSKLTALNLKNNQLTGVIPALLTTMSSLDLSNNMLSGAIPTIPLLMTRLDLSNNLLNGILPPGMCNRTYSVGCSISGGQFSANCAGCNYLAPLATTLAEYQALTNLFLFTNGASWINSQNWLVGDPCLSSWFGVTCNIGFAIVSLDLSNNNVTGSLSNSLGSLVYLTKLSLSGNGISSSIPSSITSMSSLTNLTLSNNRLNGNVPALPIGIMNLDLSSNQLSGVLPTNICSRSYSGGACSIDSGRFTTNCAGCNYLAPLATSALEFQALQDFYTSTNGGSWVNSQNWLIGDPCISSWFGITCNGAFSVVALDLTNNNVVGTLQNSFGNLIFLNRLSLSFNSVSGSIPPTFSGMISLSSVILSSNRLSGAFPPGFCARNFTACALTGSRFSVDCPSCNYFNTPVVVITSLPTPTPSQILGLSSSYQSNSQSSAGLFGAIGAVSGLLFILIPMILYFYYRRSKRQKAGRNPYDPSKMIFFPPQTTNSNFQFTHGYVENPAFSTLPNNTASSNISSRNSFQSQSQQEPQYRPQNVNLGFWKIAEQFDEGKTVSDSGFTTQTLATISSPLIALPGFLLLSNPYAHFRELKDVAVGGFGKIQSAIIMDAPNEKTQKYLDSGRSEVVLKTFIKSMESSSAEETLATFHSECSLMWAFQCNPYVVQLLGYSTSPNMLIMPLYAGHLQSILESKTPSEFPDSVLETAASQIGNAMCMLHDTRVAHLDLKPSNIFYDIVSLHPLKLHFVLGDFGIARTIDNSKVIRGLHLKVTVGLSFRYASPELFRIYGSRLTTPSDTEDPNLLLQSDVWAFGVILWQLAERNPIPWGSCSYAVVRSKALGGETLLYSTPASSLALKYKVVTESMWRLDPKERPSFESINRDL